MKYSQDWFKKNIEHAHKACDTLLFSNIEKQFFISPSKTAIIYDEVGVSYSELYYKMTLLSHYLNQLDVKKNTLVAILLPKCAYQIISALGILKAGAAYMPVNVHESHERKQSLLKQGEVKVVLTISSMMDECEWLDNYITIPLDLFFSNNEINSSYYAVDRDNLKCSQVTSSDLAYVLFTSGSTGTPKGVMISHENAMNTLEDINKRFNVTSNDKILALSALDFDLSVYDIFGVLSVGGTVIVPTEEQVIEPRQWLSLINKYQITLWDTVPGFMEMLVRCVKLDNLDSKGIKKSVASLRLVLLSGDWIRVKLPCEIHECCPNANIISLGGATEASIWSIAYPINVHEINDTWKSIPYGKALKNQIFHILDENQNIVSDKEEGELYIGGKGVGLGYWRDEINTRYHFVHHPALGYLYRTGDKGRWLSDGNIEFLGRVGEQVKLRGFRIDLKAVESCIQSVQEVKRSVVKIVRNSESSDNLVAFVECEHLADYLKNHDDVYQQLVNRHVGYWQAIYNSLVENNTFTSNPHFNTAGWVSSYSRTCFPEYQMREWRDTTVSRILALNPKHVLEVGVGTGLLLAEVAKRVSTYDVIDSSFQAVNYIEQHFKKEKEYQHVRCLEYNTNNIGQSYDTVILNSVAQYFPDAVYFVSMLDTLVEKTVKGGQIFLGDIYNYDYLEDFHLSVQLQQQSPDMSISQFHSMLKELVSKESQLYIHPQFIIDYAKQHSRITHVEIQLKSGSMHNELNGFRYDVVLSIEKIDNNLSNVHVVESDIFSTIDCIRDYLSDHKYKNVVVNSLPNLRLIGLSHYERLKEEALDTVASLRAAVYEQGYSGSIDPYDCYQLGDELGYQVCCAWSSSKYSFDVAFYTEENPLNHNCSGKSIKEKPNFQYTNTPLQYQFQRFVEHSIREKLSAHLAPYMQPHEIIFVTNIPFTANGKVNYKSLLALAEMISQEEDVNWQPNSLLEEQLVEIFKRVLNIRQVNMSKGFIQLGGDSLRMLEATHEIEKYCSVRLTIGELVANPSIREIAQILHKKSGVKLTGMVYS